jgi:hypothetical protein
VKKAIMNSRIKKLQALKMSLIIIAIALISFATSCKKADSSVNFTGTYYGTFSSWFYSESDTITIPASSSSAVVINSMTGSGSLYSINATVSGSSLSIASQSVFVPSLNATYQVTGSGTLNNSTLVIDYVFVNSGNTTSDWTFTGTKR